MQIIDSPALLNIHKILDVWTWRDNLQHAAARLRRTTAARWRELLALRQTLTVSEETGHLVMAAGVGIIGGLVNLTLFLLMEAAKRLLFHLQGEWTEIATTLPPWLRLAVPVAGGATAGLLLLGAARTLRNRSASNLLEVVVVGDGRLSLRSAIVRAAASMVSIATGGSIGREGPITHLSAAFASRWGQWSRWDPYRLRLLVACGAAAGMAAAYNAPIAGAVFAAQIVLGNFSMTMFAPLVLASVVASMVSRSFFGIEPWYHVPATVEFNRIAQLPWFLLLGGLTGLLGAGFLKALREAQSLFARLAYPLPAQLALGGLLVGAIAWWFPQVWGNGYLPTNQILDGVYGLEMIAALLAAKFLATVATVGSGAVGGIFTPTLFLGAATGAAFGMLLHWGNCALDLGTAGFALVGMGSLLAATTHSPLLAIILAFEISLDHTLMPALMTACAVSTLVTRGLHPDSIYTESLRSRGIHIDRESDRLGAATEQTVGDLMRAPVPPVAQNAAFREIADRFLTSPNNFLPVVDEQGALVGVVALQDLKAYLGPGQELSGIIAFDIMRPPPPCLTPDQRLVDTVPLLLASELRNVPVVNTRQENRLVGALPRAEALGLLSEAIASRQTEAR